MGTKINKVWSTVAYGIRRPNVTTLNGQPVSREPLDDPMSIRSLALPIPDSVPWGQGAEYAMTVLVPEGRVSGIAECSIQDDRFTRQLSRIAFDNPDPNGPYRDQVQRIADLRALPMPQESGSPGSADVTLAWEEVRRKLIQRTGRTAGWWFQRPRFEIDPGPLAGSVLTARYAQIHRIIGQIASLNSVCDLKATGESMTRHCVWWTEKFQGTITMGSALSGHRLSMLIGLFGRHGGPALVKHLGALARHATGIPLWTAGCAVTLTRGGFMRRLMPAATLALVGFPRSGGGPSLELADWGYLNANQRNRAVSAPTIEQSISERPVSDLIWFTGYEGDQFRANHTQAKMIAARSAPGMSAPLALLFNDIDPRTVLLDLPLIPGVPLAHPTVIALLYGPRDSLDWTYATDQTNQDQKASRAKMAFTKDASRRIWQLWMRRGGFKHLGISRTEAANILACYEEFALPESHASLEPGVWADMEASVAVHNKTLRSGSPPTKVNGTGDTGSSNLALESCAIDSLGGDGSGFAAYTLGWFAVPLRRHLSDGTIRNLDALEGYLADLIRYEKFDDWRRSIILTADEGMTYEWASRFAWNGDDWWRLITRWARMKFGFDVSKAEFDRAMSKAAELASLELDMIIELAEFPDLSKTGMLTGLMNGPSRGGGHVAAEYGFAIPLLERSAQDQAKYADKLSSWTSGPDGWPGRIAYAHALADNRPFIARESIHAATRWATEASPIILPDKWASHNRVPPAVIGFTRYERTPSFERAIARVDSAIGILLEGKVYNPDRRRPTDPPKEVHPETGGNGSPIPMFGPDRPDYLKIWEARLESSSYLVQMRHIEAVIISLAQDAAKDRAF